MLTGREVAFGPPTNEGTNERLAKARAVKSNTCYLFSNWICFLFISAAEMRFVAIAVECYCFDGY